MKNFSLNVVPLLQTFNAMKTIATVFLFLTGLFANAQINLAWTWTQSYINPESNPCLFYDPSAGQLVAVYNRYFDSATTAASVYAIDYNGNTLAITTDSVSGQHRDIYDGGTDGNGTLFFIGQRNSSSGVDTSTVFAMSSGFAPLWSLSFPNENPMEIERDPTGDLIALSDSDKIILRKISITGNLLWTTINDTAPGNDHLKVKKLKVDKAGNCYVLSLKKVSGDYQFSLKQFRPNGNFSWEILYNPGPNFDQPMDITIDDSCKIYVTGETYLTANGSQRGYATFKADSSGAMIWNAVYSTSSNVGRSIFADKYGNAYVAGTVAGSNYYRAVEIVKYDPSGIMMWMYAADTIGFINQQFNFPVFCVDVDSSGSIKLAYHFKPMPSGPPEFHFEMISAAGIQQQQFIYPWGSNFPYHIPGLNGNRGFIGGICLPYASATVPAKPFIFGLDNLLSVSDLPEIIPVSVFPNPSEQQITIDLGAENIRSTTYRIITTSGSRVAGGSFTGKTATVNVGDLSPGCYLLEISNEKGEVFSWKKIVKQ